MGSSVGVTQAEFRAVGLDTVRRSLDTLRKLAQDTNRDTAASARRVAEATAEGGNALGEKFAMGARRASFAIEEIARSGEVAGRGLRELIATGAEMAFSFGIGGPIVAAIGVVGLAFVNHFTRAREEIDKTRTEALTALEDIARSGDLVAAARHQGELYSGQSYALRKPDESDADFIARSQGVRGIRARIEELRRTLPKYIVDQGGLTAHARGSYSEQEFQQGNELRELITLLGQYKTQLAETIPIVNRLMAAEGDRAHNALEAAREQAGLKLPGELPEFDDAFLQRLKAAAPAIGQIGEASRSLAQQLDAQMSVLFKEYYAASTTAERRLAIEKELTDLLKQQGELAPKLVVPVPKLDGLVNGVDKFKPQWVDQMVETWKQVGESAAQGFSRSLVDGIRAGVSIALRGGGIGSIFAGVGGAIVSGLGTIFEQIGTAALAGMAIMAKIKAAIIAFAPEVGIPLALGLIAFGALLQGAGGGLGGRGGGGGGGGYGNYSSSLPQIIDRGFINPGAANAAANVTPRASITMPILAINPNDPATKRLVDETIRGLDGRGTIRGVG